MEKTNENFLIKTKKNKKLVSILTIVVGFALFFLPGQYSLLSVLVLYYGFKMANNAFLDRFSRKGSCFIQTPNRKVAQIKGIFIVPLIFIFALVALTNPEPLYRAIALAGIIPFALLYNLVDRYDMVSSSGDLSKVAAFFEKKKKHSKRLMISGFIIGFVPLVSVVGTMMLIVGIVQYFTIKVLHSNQAKFAYVHPAYVHSKYNYEN